MKNLSILLLPVTLFTSAQAFAQDQKEVKIKFRMTRFDPADRPPPEVTIADAKFKVPTHNISAPIEVKLREGTYLDLILSNRKIAIKVAESKRKDLLLLFVPKKGSYDVIPVHAPLSKLGGGSRMLINTTSAPLAIKYGKQKPVVLQKDKKVIFQSKGKDPMMNLLVSVKEGDKWKLVRSERWPNDRRFRSFVFFYQKPNSSNLHVHAIPDRLRKNK